MATLFPHLTATGSPPTSHQVMTAYRTSFATHVAAGTLRPLVLTYHLFGYIILITYLCIPHVNRPWLYQARWLVLAWILWFQWKTMWQATSMSMATGFAAGLMSAWGAVWSVIWLVFMRPQWDAKRVRARVKRSEAIEVNSKGSTSGSNGFAKENGVKKRVKSGRTKEEMNGMSVDSQDEQKVEPGSLDYDPAKDSNLEYYWQSYPTSGNFSDRFSWVFDLIVNFRLPGWNLAIPPLPSLPPGIASKLGEPLSPSSIPTSHISSVGLIRYPTRRALLAARLLYFITGYFVLDILKTLLMHDPYFIFGPTTYAPSPFLSFLTQTPFWKNFTHQFLSAFAIILSLEMVFMMAPLGLSILLGPKILGQTAEAWYYPTTWGGLENVGKKGLNGLWGSWWHQTFRFAFAAPTNFLIEKGWIRAHTNSTRILSLLFAFGISGILHSAGSISQFPSTHPWAAPTFFLLQALGISLQTIFSSVFKKQIGSLPTKVRQTGNVLFTLTWLLYTGHWLTDDFARGGIWLYEPVPLSIVRGLGLGERDAGWWCWRDGLGVGWYRGEHWWESGVAI